ncbi:intermembrane transport protein PqiB [Methylophilus medardicus]|uniref:Intermembrane transport protein PqiB n=1 Tax=Methylophilus medardicus TaxID=2588534 RepID=A0A5B8CS89_9PROT|nr:intermembrane transport protein PqiB [Methylophilus medardicus]QDC43946.1 intermembrane transport protein PqiB [Methylophilus medardicus]QDC48953.1 intermembrane transport protein PqiB [Methylophilus medardicus]QDC52658.1 intermembrane transport protein PqiB [Methylophilus medardicus]
MSESPDNLLARVSKQSRLSPIWIVPIVALLIGVWLVYDNYTRAGKQITLSMTNAEGIEAGKTKIKVHSVDIGLVEQVKLSEDLGHIQVLARIAPEAQSMLVQDTQLWVVKPRIGLEGISGLNTVLSGAYIQLQPGKSQQETDQFKVLDQPPISLNGAQGVHVNLVGNVGNALRVGDPVTYQGLRVGRVVSATFDPKQRKMQHELFIEHPYDVLVTDNTRFWTTVGIDLKLDSEGFKANIPTMESLIAGGVSFGHADDKPMGKPVKSETTFALYANEEAARQQTYSQYIEYVLLVDDTVRGLSNGAPVEFRGLRVGTVISVPWRFNSPERKNDFGYAIPVLIHLEPGRLADTGQADLAEWKNRISHMLKNGLHATLKSGNLLTGSLFVDLNMEHQSHKSYRRHTFEGLPVLPTSATSLAQIEQKLSDLLDKLNQLKVEPVLAGLDKNLQQSEQTLQEIRALSQQVNQFVSQPEVQQMPSNLNQTMQALRTTMQGLSPDSPAYQELTTTLQRLEKVLRDVQPLVRTLNEQPNAILFNRKPGNDPVPQAPAAP